MKRVRLKRQLNLIFTLIARVQIAAITSREPPNMRLSFRVGSYSQIAVAFSTAAIFVMFDMTATLPRLTTWARHGNCCSPLFHLRPRRSWMRSIVLHVVLLFPVLSNVAA